MDLSVIIPARNEEFLQLTIDEVLKQAQAETEVIAILDGYWPEVGIPQQKNLTVVHFEKSIGQRASTNVGARISRAKYVMKLDAHCKVDTGFDIKLMSDCEYDWTVIPRMYNLHVFDWKCNACGHQVYQGPEPESCSNCKENSGFEKIIIWQRRKNRRTDFWRFDSDMKFQYWQAYKKRPEAKGDICDVMSSIGACFFMHRQRFWDLGGMDENHGSWGQFGTEVACKSWLSGGRHVVNKKTWFAHLFRTNNKGFSFPYKIKGKQVGHARRYSKDMWLNDKWEGATRPLSWLINHFNPVPDWNGNDIRRLKQSFPTSYKKTKVSKSLVYYTDNTGDPDLMQLCRDNTEWCMKQYGYPIISVSQKPLDFGKNIVMELERAVLSIFKQILRGCQETDTQYVFLLEHDVLYHPSHFDYTPQDNNTFYYDHNRYSVCDETGKSVFYHTDVPSMMVASRELLIKHYSKCVKWVEKEGWKSKYGYSPPKGVPKDMKEGRRDTWMSLLPSLDIRRKDAWSRKRMSRKQFRNPRGHRGWKEVDEVEGWGAIHGRFADFVQDVKKRLQ